jgi:uncharacterized protein
MKVDILNILVSFSFFSILGWMLEIAYRSLRDKRFVNPGLLKGPYLILYGTGALILMGAFPLLQESHLITKALAYCAITTGLELISGFIAQYFFHVRLWDYSDQRFHYKGYICLKFSIYWILPVFAFEYLIFPQYQGLLNQLSSGVKGIFAAVTLSIMLLDFLTVSIRRFLSMTPKEKTMVDTQFINTARPLLEDPRVAKLSQYEHHRGKTRLEHVTEVAYISFLWGNRFSLDSEAITRGALLHDFFFYDWLHEGPRLHGFRHPDIALRNAREITPLSRKEEDIIKKHMWPLTVVPPHYKESLIVSMVDTFCSARDYLGIKEHDKTAKAAAVCVNSESGDKRV